MIEDVILQSLQDAIKEAVAQSSNPDLPVSFVGLTFTVPNDQKYLELVYLPNNGSDRYWGNEKAYQGVFRFVLHWPLGAPYPPMQLIASIAQYFDKTKNLNDSVQIVYAPDLTPPIREGGEMLYPATMRYQRFDNR
jgi:hypothetical protein